MSYDISLYKGKRVKARIGNYTYNISPMYLKALGTSLLELDGVEVNIITPILLKGVEDMVNNKEEYLKLNPENGWGNYEGALEYLQKLLAECLKFPTAKIEVN